MSRPINQQEIPKLFEDLKQREFFGKVTLEFHRGRPKLLRIEKTKIIEEETQHASYKSNR